MRSGNLFMIQYLSRMRVATLLQKLNPKVVCFKAKMSNSKKKIIKLKTDIIIYFVKLQAQCIYLIFRRQKIPEECMPVLIRKKLFECLATEFNTTNLK